MTTRDHEPTRTDPSAYEPLILDVSVQSEAEAMLLVEVRGELDLATGSTLRQHLEAFNKTQARGVPLRRITYHLSGVEFMDASGLRALLEAVDGTTTDTIFIRDPSAPVRRVLELVGLHSMIEVTEK